MTGKIDYFQQLGFMGEIILFMKAIIIRRIPKLCYFKKKKLGLYGYA